MGGAASKEQLESSTSNHTGKADAKGTAVQEPLLTQSPFDTGVSGDEKFDESGSSGKPVASATKLKRIALGQTTYMDQQRDYDQVLNKLDLNKSGVVEWIEPGRGSPAGKVGAHGGSFSSPVVDAKFSTPNGGSARVKKPPPPNSKPSPLAPNVHPTQQIVNAPHGTPSRIPQGADRVLSPNGPDIHRHHSNVDMASQPHGHSHSFSTPQKAGPAPHTGPGHNQSGSQLLPRHNVHNQVASSSGLHGPPSHGTSAVPAAPGPPPGLVSRPFPGTGPSSADPQLGDFDDSMIAEFGHSIRVEDSKKPDFVPPLSIAHPKSNASSSKTPVNAFSPAAAGQLPQIGRKTPTPGSAGQGPAQLQPVPRAQPYVSPAMYASGPGAGMPGQGLPQLPTANAMNGAPLPHGFTGQGLALSTSTGVLGMQTGTPGQPMRPMTMGGNGAAPPGTTPTSGNARPAPAPVPIGGAKLAAPVVKETKNVKRNRAQIPTQLAHALPTTGDWINKRYIVNNYILLEILGTGSYGEVRLCKDRTTDKLFAIKIFSKDFLKKKKNGRSDETFFEDIKREIAIMKKLLHPNVLRLFEVLDDPKVNKMYLVLEYMKMGDLINVLKSRGADANTNTTSGADAAEGTFTPLTDMEVWNIFRQVVSGIRYLHYQNVVHGDIKPQNLLLGEDGLVKIADFGISQMLSASGQKLADAAGTPAFMSPELCEGKSFSGQLADIWAIGATMFMLRFGHPPFLAKSIINLYHKICHDPLVFPGPIDPGLKNLLENLLEKDPNRRYTLQQIIMHPWFRHPPSAHTHQLQQAALNARSGLINSTNNNTTNAATTTKTAGATTTTDAQQASITFKPPASYEADEEAAMKVPVKIDHNDEVFMSIGGIQRQNKSQKSAPEAKKIDEDAKDSTCNSDAEELEVETGGDMMGTDWGADVFQMVDDGDNSDNVDDDSVDEDSDGETETASAKPAASGKDDPSGKSNQPSKHGSMSSMMNTRTEMSQEEEEKRARRFMNKMTRKSNENMELDKRFAKDGASKEVAYDSKDSSTTSMMSPAKTVVKGATAATAKATLEAADSFSDLSSSAANVKTVKSSKLPFKAMSAKSGLRNRNDSIRASVEDNEEETDELTMDDFNRMMDTLALQPKNFSNMAENDVPAVNGGLLPIDGFCAELLNKKNGIAAAFYSEKGVRHTQEDRCVLFPNVGEMKGLESANFDKNKLQLLSNFSIAAMFDGHSGWRTSHYLSQHLPAALVMHEKFLDKTCEAALLDVCATMDTQVCNMLMDEEDASGSTGVIAVYDGRRHILTVAGVGDSMCVLSRSGKAVMLNRMHRLDNADEVERIKRAGGTVINKRVNGLLAISRAFGDTQFKPERDDDNPTQSSDGLVISTPEVCSEHITPMTEFAIIATDGLWDVMTPQMAVTFVRNLLHKHRDLEEAAKGLSQEAITRGSVDNVTVLIMSFHFTDEGKIKGAKPK